MQCPNCSAEMKVVPAGVSRKTGKPYRSFSVCETPQCKEEKERYKQQRQAPQQQALTCNCDERFSKVTEWKKSVEERLANLATFQHGQNPDAAEFHQSFRPAQKKALVDNLGVKEEDIPQITKDQVDLDLSEAPWGN